VHEESTLVTSACNLPTLPRWQRHPTRRVSELFVLLSEESNEAIVRSLPCG
jgi:hypothetical protein